MDIRTWLPGDQWNRETQGYDVEPAVHEARGVFTLPSAVPQGEYILALAILDPAGMLPAVRFVIENCFVGGRHPMGIIGVGKASSLVELDRDSFADPMDDRTLRYEWEPNR